MASNAFTEMIGMVASKLPGPLNVGLDDKYGKEVIDIIRTDFDRNTVTVRINSLAKMIAEDYLKNKSIIDLRQQIKLYGGNGRRVKTVDQIYSETGHDLNFDLIWHIYNIILRLDSEQVVKTFSKNFKDPYHTLIVNAAFEIASRCVGISFTSRKTDSDLQFFMNHGYLLKPDDAGYTISKLLNDANVQVVNRTIILALLPFINVSINEPIKSISINKYGGTLKKYAKTTNSSADRIVFNKLVDLIERSGYHDEAKIVPFNDDQVTFNTWRMLSLPSSNMPKASVIELQNGFNENKLSEVLNCYHKPTGIVNVEQMKAGNFYTTLLLSTFDWLWRFRMKWNHEMAVGSALTTSYTKLFMANKKQFASTLTYTSNRYLLETIGQSFIGYESYAFDKKCKLLRKIAKSLKELIELSADGWCESYHMETLVKIYSVSDCDDVDLFAFLNTLDILNKNKQIFTLYHFMSAFVFYAKFVLQDYALNNIDVTADLSIHDIELWLNYE